MDCRLFFIELSFIISVDIDFYNIDLIFIYLYEISSIIDSNNINLKRMDNSHLVIAHRGYCSIFPENTLESF